MRKTRILKHSVSAIMVIIFSTIMIFYGQLNFNVSAVDYNFCFPVNNGVKIAFYQGYTPDYGADHDGIDIHASKDDTIYAAYSGVVDATANSCPHINYGGKCAHWTTYGNYIRIKGDNGIYFYYGHLKQNTLKVKKGDRVIKGQPIATMGSSGYSTGKHLHFEIRKTTASSTRLNANPKGTLNGLVTYANGPYPSPKYVEIPQDHYYIKNASTGTYLNISGGKAANGQAAAMSAKQNSNSFKFYASGSKDKGYYLLSLIDKNYALNPYSDTPGDGTKITLYKKSTDGTQLYFFEKSGSGYIIHNAYNQNLVLTPSGSNVLLKTKTGAANQVWTLEQVVDKKLTGISIATPATKGRYWCNETVPTAEITAGLSLKATYSDGSTKNINSGFTPKCDFSNVGTSTITISYTEDSITKTTSYNVTVGYPFSGEGTASNPFLISNQDELFRLAQIINNTRYSSYNNRYYKQTADIDLENKNWTPIGRYYENDTSENTSVYRTFNGKYNGNHHKIIGLNVNYDRYYAGLFGRGNAHCEIYNLAVEGNVVSSSDLTGGIIGAVSYGAKVYDCSFSGLVTSKYNVGGITGIIHQGGSVVNCYANATITASDKTYGYAGGITGYMRTGGESEICQNASVVNCYFVGKTNGAAKNGGITCGVELISGTYQPELMLSNCYYAETASAGAVNDSSYAGCVSLSESQLKSAASQLGVAYISAGINQNDGYPVFEWQRIKPTGDVNSDGIFNISDAVILKKWLIKDKSVKLDNWQEGDLNCDGTLNVFDFCIMKRELIK